MSKDPAIEFIGTRVGTMKAARKSNKRSQPTLGNPRAVEARR
jgi:hypothetical protein